MDPERETVDELTDLEKDIEAWNLPRAPILVPAPPLELWPEKDLGLEAGLAALEDEPVA